MKAVVAVLAMLVSSTLAGAKVKSSLDAKVVLKDAIAINPALIQGLIKIANTNTIPDVVEGACDVLNDLADNIVKVANDTTDTTLFVVYSLLNGIGIDAFDLLKVVDNVLDNTFVLVNGILDGVLGAVCDITGAVAAVSDLNASDLKIAAKIKLAVNPLLKVVVNLNTGSILQLTDDQLAALIDLINALAASTNAKVQTSIKA